MSSCDDPCVPVAWEPCKVPVDYFMPIGTTGVRFVARLDAILRAWGPEFSASDMQRANLRAASTLAQTGMIRGQAFAFMRNGAQLTEAQAAALCGVDVPTLQAWEAETLSLPMTAWKTLAHYVTDLDGRDHYMTTPPCPPENWQHRDIRVYPDFLTFSGQGPLGSDGGCIPC